MPLSLDFRQLLQPSPWAGIGFVNYPPGFQDFQTYPKPRLRSTDASYFPVAKSQRDSPSPQPEGLADLQKSTSAGAERKNSDFAHMVSSRHQRVPSGMLGCCLADAFIQIALLSVGLRFFCGRQDGAAGYQSVALAWGPGLILGQHGSMQHGLRRILQMLT